MKKKGQAWGFDVIMGSIIFILGLVIFFLYSLNYPRQSEDTIDILEFEGDFISENLLSAGNPDNWDENNVIRIGITNNNKVNQTKLERLYYMANVASNNGGYNKTKSLLNTRYEFFFNFTQQIEIGNPPEPLYGGIGKNFTDNNPENLIKITRLVIYNNQPTTLQLYIWE